MTDVLLLTKEDCKFCEQAKDVLARLTDEYGLTVRELGFDSDEGRSLALSAGALFPPAVFLDGEPFSYGRLSERRLRKELRAGAASRIGGSADYTHVGEGPG
ncbi:MAG: glutaredoxin family protein [Actinomycetota bacterium]